MTDKQTWDAEGYDKNARFVSDLGGAVLNMLAPKPGERILDLGCGDGALTEKIAALGAEVIGIDTSPQLLEAAANRGLDVCKMDGRYLDFDAPFNAVFSNAVLHWINEPDQVISSVWNVLKPGGRFVAEFGGHGNVAALVTAMRAVGLRHNGDPALAGPWFFPTSTEYSMLLERAGFRVESCDLIPRPTPLPTDMKGWLLTFRKPFFDQFEGDECRVVLTEVLDLLRPSLCDKAGQWTADYVRIRVHAIKT